MTAAGHAYNDQLKTPFQGLTVIRPGSSQKPPAGFSEDTDGDLC